MPTFFSNHQISITFGEPNDVQYVELEREFLYSRINNRTPMLRSVCCAPIYYLKAIRGTCKTLK